MSTGQAIPQPTRITAGQLKQWLQSIPDDAQIWLYENEDLEGITALQTNLRAHQITVYRQP